MSNNFILPFQSPDDKRLIPQTPTPSPVTIPISPISPFPEYEKTIIKQKRPIPTPYIRPTLYNILGNVHLEPLEPIDPREGVVFEYPEHGKRRIYGPSTNQYNCTNSGIRMDLMQKLIKSGGTVFNIDNNFLTIVRDDINLPLIEKISNRTWQFYNSIARGVETDDANIMFCGCPSTKGSSFSPLQIGKIYTLSKGNNNVNIMISHIFTNSNDPKIKHYWGYLSKH